MKEEEKGAVRGRNGERGRGERSREGLREKKNERQN